MSPTTIRVVTAQLLAVSCSLFNPTNAIGQSATVSKSGDCWRDYDVPAPSVNYELAFASETLAPQRITLDGKAVRLGMSENELNQLLGVTSTVVEESHQRSELQQCEYLSALLRKHANSMHLYIIGALKLKKMSGLFRVSEWQLPGVGVLRVFFHKHAGARLETSYLTHLTLQPTSTNNIQRNKPPGYVLVRRGQTIIEWDVDMNRVSISRR